MGALTNDLPQWVKDALDRTLQAAPPCIARLSLEDRMAVAAWAVRDQVRLLRRYVAELEEVAKDAVSEADEADRLADILEGVA